MDLHAITVPHDAKELRAASHSTAAGYIAAGIDPQKSRIFMQSHVPGHSELQWLLGCYTPLGWLERMIQFKEKSRKQGESVGSGLLTYPILMAADILLYQVRRFMPPALTLHSNKQPYLTRGPVRPLWCSLLLYF